MKGIDSTFLKYGIRQEDLSLITSICAKYNIDPEWLKDEILEEYNLKKTKNQGIDDKSVAKLINEALKNLDV